MPLPDRGPKGSAALWDRYMASNPSSQRKAFDAVLDAAREIDFKHGTDTTSKFRQISIKEILKYTHNGKNILSN